MIELNVVADMISLPTGTGVLALGQVRDSFGPNRWRFDIGRVTTKGMGKIAIRWGEGKDVWYDNRGRFWYDRNESSYGSYDMLTNQRHSKVFSLSDVEYAYFELFMR